LIRFFIFILLILNVADVKAEEASPKAITVGVIPGGNPKELKIQGMKLVKELQEKINVPVNLYISKDYVGLLEAMKTKKIEFAFFNSMTYVFAENQAQAKVLLKKVWEGPFYYSALITPDDSGIKNLKEIKGHTIAFVDDKSSSGFLYPQVALRKAGLSEADLKAAVFSGNHQASVELLEADKVKVAAVFTDDEAGQRGAWIKFAKDKKKKYRILWVSSPIPNDPFCVRQDFYDSFPKTTHNLMFALMEIFEKEKNNGSLSEILGSGGLMLATTRQYDPVREMVKLLNIELKPK